MSGTGPPPCPACGAPLGGRAGCQAVFDAVGALSWTSPVRGAVHNLAVDTYAMQHPEEYGRSAKSYAAHLLGLCCGIEHPGDAKLYWSIARWLDGGKLLDKPPLLASRGRSTIPVPGDAESDAQFAARVRVWAADVWDAYADQQALARQWLAEARRGAG